MIVFSKLYLQEHIILMCVKVIFLVQLGFIALVLGWWSTQNSAIRIVRSAATLSLSKDYIMSPTTS